MSDLPDWMATMHSRAVQSRSPVQTAIQAPPIPYRNAPRNRPPPRQMRPVEQRAIDPNAGVRRQAMAEFDRRSAADMPTLPRAPMNNQFRDAGEMAFEGTGLPSVRRGARTLTDVARAPYAPDAPQRALGGLGELGMGAAGALSFGEFAAMRPRGRVQAPPRLPVAPTGPHPEALALARTWIDSFGGGPSAEARAIEVMRGQLQGAGHPVWRQRLQDAIDSVGARTYAQGEPNSFSARVEEAWPEIYRPEAPPRMTPPAREIAPNGMTIRPSEPFRNSLRGGSDDLAEAARPTSTPDAGGGRGGNVSLDDLRAQGFDVETPLYHGSMNDIDGELLPSDSGMLGGGIYLTPNRARASKYTERYSDGSRDPSQRGRVYDVAVRGEIVNVADHPNMTPMEVLTSAQERGASGVRWGDTIVIWNKDNVRRIPAAPDVGSAGFVETNGAAPGLRRLADPNGKGFVDYAIGPDGGWRIRDAMISDPANRGKGIGTALYEELIARARNSGAPYIASDTRVSPDAQRVWESLARRHPVERIDGEYSAAYSDPNYRLRLPPNAPARSPDGPKPSDGKFFGRRK